MPETAGGKKGRRTKDDMNILMERRTKNHNHAQHGNQTNDYYHLIETIRYMK